MSSAPPPEKKQKTDGDAAGPSWRDRCIARFDLKPVPKAWEKAVAVGSDGAWARYYKYREAKEEADARKKCDEDRYNSDGDDVSEDDPEKEGMSDIVYSWAESAYGMKGIVEKCMKEGCTWQWTPSLPRLSWDDARLRSADYRAYVWSPFAIPHAIWLSHDWAGKIRWDGYDLAVDWSYSFLDFEEDGDFPSFECEEICSSKFDVIKTTKLNKTTCGKLRKFLYGASTKKSKELTCSDLDFWILLFGSMGSTDKNLMEDAKECSLGYSWCPWKDKSMKQKLFDEKAPANDDPNGEPPASVDKYSPRWCSWLRYRILEVSDSLGPISKHYQPPPAKKVSPRNDDSYGYWG